MYNREPVERLVTVLLSSVEIVHRVGFLQGVHPAINNLGKWKRRWVQNPSKTKSN